MAAAAVPQRQRRRNRDNGGGNRGGGSISDRNVNRGSGDRPARGGGEVRRWNGGDGSTRTVDRTVFVPQRPALGYAYSPYRRGYVYPALRYDPWLRHYYGWSPIRFAPWGWIYGTSAFAAWGYGYNYAPYYGYGYNGPRSLLRIRRRQQLLQQQLLQQPDILVRHRCRAIEGASARCAGVRRRFLRRPS
jgi:hypothetical protein